MSRYLCQISSTVILYFQTRGLIWLTLLSTIKTYSPFSGLRTVFLAKVLFYSCLLKRRRPFAMHDAPFLNHSNCIPYNCPTYSITPTAHYKKIVPYDSPTIYNGYSERMCWIFSGTLCYWIQVTLGIVVTLYQKHRLECMTIIWFVINKTPQNSTQ